MRSTRAPAAHGSDGAPVSPRLFVPFDLAADLLVELSCDQSHYLTHVMRRVRGDPARVFNGRHGEWSAVISGVSKRSITLHVQQLRRPQTVSADLTLLFAPVKKARTDFIVEKATELGVRRIAPVWTERTQSDTVRIDRLGALAREAAEQCERLDVPEITAPEKLERVLADWPGARVLIFADEAFEDLTAAGGAATSSAAPISVIAAGVASGAPLAVLIGPEGGFTDGERERLRSLAYVRPARLGPRILRSDTAVAAALSIVQAIWGDCADPSAQRRCSETARKA